MSTQNLAGLTHVRVEYPKVGPATPVTLTIPLLLAKALHEVIGMTAGTVSLPGTTHDLLYALYEALPEGDDEFDVEGHTLVVDQIDGEDGIL